MNPTQEASRRPRSTTRQWLESGLPILVGAAVAHRGPQPVRFGVPFARGDVQALDCLHLESAAGEPLPRDVECLARWSDGSVRWACLEMLLDLAGAQELELRLRLGDPRERLATAPLAHSIVEGGWKIETGELAITLGADVLTPIRRAERHGTLVSAGSRLRIEDAHGRVWVDRRAGPSSLRARGTVRIEVRTEGTLLGPRRRRLEIRSRLEVWAGSGLVRCRIRIRNPARARHRGGFWDLGDSGSLLLSELSLGLESVAAERHRIAWRVEPEAPIVWTSSSELSIHQESSGGENWRSPNHVDRTGRIPLRFRGAEIRDGTRRERVPRPSPVAYRVGGDAAVGVAVPRFWQEFPKRLAIDEEGTRVGLFPREHGGLLELQGGEQKQFEVWIDVRRGGLHGEPSLGLEWVHGPARVRLPPEYGVATGAVPGLVAEGDDRSASYVRLARRGIAGPSSFFAKREVIDEYGWRSFGDTWADHEDEHFAGPSPVISHYNNQYDLVLGFALHFLRSGDRRWLELAEDLARHVIDIDRYHTREDRTAYNGGQFWHTEHYRSAGRGTHRSYSRDAHRVRRRRGAGGGPANEQNYTSGLLLLHYLTGDEDAADAVQGLAEWVVAMDDGGDSIVAPLESGPTGKASVTRDSGFHGPGRGAGNSINALVDAFLLTGDRAALAFAELLIRRSVHPDDDPEAMNLLDVENRWSYTVFLQVLGKYLEVKHELAEHDDAFEYARAVLHRYAGWMAEREVAFGDYRDRVEYPTESWPAQDLRKAAVLDLAARFGPAAHRAGFLDAAERFHRAAVEGVLAFGTATTTRALAVVLATGAAWPGRALPPLRDLPPWREAVHPRPPRFIAQKQRVLAHLKTVRGALRAMRHMASVRTLGRLVRGRIW